MATSVYEKIESSSQVWLTGVSGILKTAQQEWNRVKVKAIDLARNGQSPLALANRLADEIIYGDDGIEVGLPVKHALF